VGGGARGRDRGGATALESSDTPAPEAAVTTQRELSEVAGDPFASLSDAVPALVWIADQAGRWLHANERWRDLTGDDPVRLLGDGWRGDVHPDDLPDLLAAQDAALAAGEAFEIVHRMLAADGEYRWMLSRGAPRRSADGAPNGYVGACVDINERRQVGDQLRESEALLDTIVQCAPMGFALLDLEMRYVRVNQSLAEMNGIEQEDHIGRRPAEILPGVPGELIATCFQRVLQTGEQIDGVEVTGETPAQPGEERHWLVSWYPVRHDGAIVGVGSFVTDITDRMRAERGIALLARVGEALDATLGVDERLARLADLVVPSLADFCTIETVDGLGGTEIAASSPLTPEEAERVAALRAEADSPAVIVAPLRTRGRDLGSLTLAMGSSGRRFDDRTRSLVRQLARRASLAVDNARLFEDQRRIAGTLQQSLLPRELPEIEGLDIAARFSPGGDGHEVGGDFYDVFEARGTWAVVIGDVCGKGASAASLTSLCRHAARTLSRHDPPPSRLLTELNERIMIEPDVDLRFSTAAYARLTRTAGTLIVTASSAGHPLPLVVRASGRVEELGEPGTLLGLLPVVRVTDHSTELAPGDALVMFTDGVTEARRDGILFGDDRLRELLSGLAGRPADEMAAAIEGAAIGFQGGPLADDLAVVVVRVVP
jgi:PAS domain S-box-containing protein